VVGHAGSGYAYAVVYDLRSGSGPCAELVGGYLGLESFHGNDGKSTKVDYSVNKVAIQAESITEVPAVGACFSKPDAKVGYAGGDFSDPDPSHTLFALGAFREREPDADDYCYIDGLSAAQASLPEIPASEPPPRCSDEQPASLCDGPGKTFTFDCRCDAAGGEGCCEDVPGLCEDNDARDCQSDDQCCDAGDAACLADPPRCVSQGPVVESCRGTTQPALDVRYEWSDVKLYTTAAALGTQLSATLRYSVNDCTAEYDVRAVWPATDCTLYDIDYNPILDDEGNLQPDPSACCPGSDLEKNHPYGSGINPDFAVHCDPELLLCVLDKAVPSLNSRGTPEGCPPPQTIE
jgi:hypothetical protein